MKSSSNVNHFPPRLTSTSCDQLSFPSQTLVNETTHIIKTSSSWPEANMFARQDQEQIQSSSSSSQFEPTSLTFSLRWDEKIKSLFVRVISARDLFRQKPYRQPLIIDSYVRIQLISANNETNPSSKILLLISFFFITFKNPKVHSHPCGHISSRKILIQSTMNYSNLPIWKKFL